MTIAVDPVESNLRRDCEVAWFKNEPLSLWFDVRQAEDEEINVFTGRNPFHSHLERLEGRVLFDVVASGVLGDVFRQPGQASESRPLAGVFVSNSFSDLRPVVSLPVMYGSGSAKVSSAILIELFDTTPRTTENFLRYVSAGRYNGTFFHRSVSSFALQAGGFTYSASRGPVAIPSFGLIASEFSTSPRGTGGLVNRRGTLAMATLPAELSSSGVPIPGTGPDSATSQWFVNLSDNVTLDVQNGGFTTFARVLQPSMSVVDGIASLATIDADGENASTFDKVPIASQRLEFPDDLAVISDPAVLTRPEIQLHYSVSSTDESVVKARVDEGGELVLDFGTGSGFATVSVTASDLAGSQASKSFNVTLGDPRIELSTSRKVLDLAATGTLDLGVGFVGVETERTLLLKNNGTGPLAINDLRFPLGLEQIGSSPSILLPGQEHLLRLSVRTSSPSQLTGQISFATNARNASDGRVTLNVLLNVTAGLTLGSGGASSISFADSDGTRSTIRLRGPGSGQIRFAGNNVLFSTSRGTITVAGDGLSVDRIQLSGTSINSALSAVSTRGNKLFRVRTLTATEPVGSILLPSAEVTGEITLQSLARRLEFAGLNGGHLSAMTTTLPRQFPTLSLGTVQSASVAFVGTLNSITATLLSGSTVSATGSISQLSLRSTSSSLIRADGNIASIVFAREFVNSVIEAPSVRSVTVGTWAGSVLRVGVLSSSSITSTPQFSPSSFVRSFTITSRSTDAFAGSEIMARRLGSIRVGSLSASGQPTNISFEEIGTISGVLVPRRTFSVRGITDKQTWQQLDTEFPGLPERLRLLST